MVSASMPQTGRNHLPTPQAPHCTPITGATKMLVLSRAPRIQESALHPRNPRGLFGSSLKDTLMVQRAQQSWGTLTPQPVFLGL